MSKPATIRRLTTDVTNPKPDKRQRYDWRVFPTIFEATHLVHFDWVGHNGAPVKALRPVAGRWTSQCLLEYEPLYKLLMDASVELPREDLTTEEVLEMHGLLNYGDRAWFVDALLDAGIGATQMRDAIESIAAKLNAENINER